ncbi:MAG: hypothetical protein AB2L13_00245 [Spirochaetota bacterium]
MSRRPAWWLPVLARIWPITWMSAKATTWPVVGGFIARLTLPLFSGKNLNVSYIPINETLTPPGSTPLPLAVVEELIRRSAHRVIINKCTCRDARAVRGAPGRNGLHASRRGHPRDRPPHRDGMCRSAKRSSICTRRCAKGSSP